ncbi:MAG: hypothetical protein ACREFF_07945 [Candidatus Udaeobacter sp.]
MSSGALLFLKCIEDRIDIVNISAGENLGIVCNGFADPFKVSLRDPGVPLYLLSSLVKLVIGNITPSSDGASPEQPLKIICVRHRQRVTQLTEWQVKQVIDRCEAYSKKERSSVSKWNLYHPLCHPAE